MTSVRTARLLLLPLSRDMLQERLRHDEFTLRHGELELRFPTDWPGDPLPIFPALLHGLSEEGPEEGEVLGSFVLVQAATGLVVGMMGSKDPPNGAGEVEIGYGLIPAAWGQGYATEAVAELVRHLHTWPDVRTLTAETSVTNLASERVLQKLGFRRTGSSWSEEDGDLHTWAHQR
ncbi:N-acetyltransferase [Deinococcus cavernae]|uniref:N-acetyltransferase n=1 Tax=Deinococcus cavernae TaxID=2320857 RepID=A0A418VCE4_9DEIO|nr:N-acetyltransferase [Deinococcus cavernae]